LYTYVPVAIKTSTESKTAIITDENSLIVFGRITVLLLGIQNACMVTLLEVSFNERGLAV